MQALNKQDMLLKKDCYGQYSVAILARRDISPCWKKGTVFTLKDAGELIENNNYIFFLKNGTGKLLVYKQTTETHYLCFRYNSHYQPMLVKLPIRRVDNITLVKGTTINSPSCTQKELDSWAHFMRERPDVYSEDAILSAKSSNHTARLEWDVLFKTWRSTESFPVV